MTTEQKHTELQECESCGELLPDECFKEAAALDGWGDEPCCDACFYKSERDTLAAKVGELKNDVEHYRSAYKAAHNQAMANGQRAREFEAQRDELRKFASHHPECKVAIGKPCDCGYDNIIAKIEAEKIAKS